ncbi:hypothetical protein ACQEVZ_02715 [Dactylosporangium sp. CA-152071]|uniref:hypothetical protein n=1 Tax=Dactylosporangium sp. CA-152071 TaxID=3239933 RepID=UPI003D8B1FD9
MGLAKARRIAARAHRGQLFAGGGLLLGHLERVDRILAGADAAVRQAAWLHLVPGRGVSAADLARAGVPPRAVHLVESMSWRPWDDRARFTERLVRTPGAAAIRHAVLTDLHDHLAGEHAYEYWREQHIRLAAALGLARPPEVEVETELPEPPGRGGHLDDYARRLGAIGTGEALTALLAAYETAKAGRARACCLGAVRSGVFAIATRPETASRRLAVAWWDSGDAWERLVAVEAQVASGEPVDRDRLLDVVERETGWLAVAAIRGLARHDVRVGEVTGPAGDRELRLLAAAAAIAGPEHRRVRRAAVDRLRAIGGPAAEAALHGRGSAARRWTGCGRSAGLRPRRRCTAGSSIRSSHRGGTIRAGSPSTGPDTSRSSSRRPRIRRGRSRRPTRSASSARSRRCPPCAGWRGRRGGCRSPPSRRSGRSVRPTPCRR